MTVEMHLDGEIFHARVHEGELDIVQGPAIAPDLSLRSTQKTVIRLGVGVLGANQAIEAGLVELNSGEPSTLADFVVLFEFPHSG